MPSSSSSSSLSLAHIHVDTTAPVLVTGATGYLAGVLIQELLELGVVVHACVRDPTNEQKLEHLTSLPNYSKNLLKFFKADLLEPNSYELAMKDCKIVFHTASPFVVSVDDPERDLILPAVQGTRNVLSTCNTTPTVRRVVLTSSTTAIHTDASESSITKPLTENDWNRTASLSYQPYNLSKTLAEQAAWVIAGSQTQWSLVVVNPSLIMGPGIQFHSNAESFQLLKRLVEMPLIPNFGFGVVDVRDVVMAHVIVAYNHACCGRHIICGHNTNFMDMASAIRQKYYENSSGIATRKVSKSLLWLLGPYLGVGRRFVKHNCDVPVFLDNTKSITELGVKYRSLQETMQDMYQQMMEYEQMKSSSSNKKED